MVRTMKKAVSAAMALVMTTGLFITGNGSVVKTYAAGESEEQFVNSKYVEVIGDGKYSTGVSYDDGIILLSNVTDSTYADKGNLKDKVTLSADSELAFMDKDGIDHVLENTDENGNQKFDAIYGSVSQSYYQLNIIEKDSKLGAINDAGEIVTLNGQQWFDNMYIYNADGIGYVYGLEQYTSGNVFDFTVVSEDGNELFTVNNCNNVRDISYYTNSKYTSYFLMLDRADGTSILMDFSGKIWHDGDKIKSCSVSSSNSTEDSICVVVMYNNSYGYYDYATGEKIEGEGRLRSQRVSGKGTKYVAVNNGKTVIYNAYMEVEYELEGEYYNLGSINSTGKGKAVYTLINSDYQTINIVNKDGSKWFDSDSEIVSRPDISSAEGGIFKLSDGNSYFVSDGGDIRIKQSDLMRLANVKLEELYGSFKYTGLSFYMTDFGAVLSYTMFADGSVHNILITKESEYSEAKYIGDGDVSTIKGGTPNSMGGILYFGETVDKTITMADGSTVACNKKVTKAYDMYNAELKEIEMPASLYRDSKTLYFYSDEGKKYRVTSDGLTEVISQTHSNSPYIRKIGNTGAYIYSLYENGRTRYKLYDANDKEVDIGLDALYSSDNYRSIYLNTLDMGYVTVSYYDNNQRKTIYKIYTYFGEHVLDYSGFITNYVGKAGKIYFVDNKAMRFKDISGVLNDSSLREDSTIKIETIKGSDEKAFSGLKENSSIEDIKKELPGLDISVLDSEGKELPAAKPVGTGCKIQVIRDGKVIDTATVVVKGDTDGSGTIDVLDMEAVQKSILGIGEGLTGAYNEAAKLSESDKISVLDMEAIQKDILGLQKINKDTTK